MCFNNPQIHSQWREAWKLKEDALKERYVKTLENLNEHTRPLAPLRHGDHVLIQNQRGRYPNKWDHSGTIVETKPNDQYVVKVAGSGRLTLRNRRFLRVYQKHNLLNSSSNGDVRQPLSGQRVITPVVSPTPTSSSVSPAPLLGRLPEVRAQSCITKYPNANHGL